MHIRKVIIVLNYILIKMISGIFIWYCGMKGLFCYDIYKRKVRRKNEEKRIF